MKEHPAPRTLLDLHLAGELIPTGVGSIGSMELSTPERDRLITLQHAVIAGARAMEERNQMLLRLVRRRGDSVGVGGGVERGVR